MPETSSSSRAMGYTGRLVCDVPVRDDQTSLRWYREVLGFELDYQIPDIGWCEGHASRPAQACGAYIGFVGPA